MNGESLSWPLTPALSSSNQNKKTLIPRGQLGLGEVLSGVQILILWFNTVGLSSLYTDQYAKQRRYQ